MRKLAAFYHQNAAKTGFLFERNCSSLTIMLVRKSFCSRALLQAFFLLAAFLPSSSTAFSAETWKLYNWEPAFDYGIAPKLIDYEPVEKAKKPWLICVSFPHLKDSYWISVNYGMVEQAKRAGVQLKIVEAGGYPDLAIQAQQIHECSAKADALIVGAVSYDGLTDEIKEIGTRIPVIAAVNDVSNIGISAKAGVSWEEMGRSVGAYLAKLHPRGSKKVKIAWFPGSRGAGWVSFTEIGFFRGLADSSAEIVTTKWGDTGFEIQLLLLEEALEEHPEIDYIVGSAPTADAAVSILRAQGREGQIGIIADYFTHGTYRAIHRGKVLAAPSDFPPMQGRIAIDQAIRAIEGTLVYRHVGPRVELIDASNIGTLEPDTSLAPAWFKPTYNVP